MFKRILKWFGAIIAVVAIAIAVFLINLIWFRPWSLNLFYEKVFAEILFDHPEILSTLGLVEQFSFTSIRSIANRRRKSFPHACWIGFCEYKPKAKSGNGMIIRSTSFLVFRTSFRLSWRIHTGCRTQRIAITT